MYIVTQHDLDALENYVFKKSYATIEEAKEAVEECRQLNEPGIHPARWDDAFPGNTEQSICLLHDYTPEDDCQDMEFIIHLVDAPTALQAAADQLSDTLNKFIDGVEYDGERQEYHPDNSEAEYGHLLYGKMQMLQELDPNLNWKDDDQRFDIMDMSLFSGD